MQVGPVRWVFIKSPTTRQPYKYIRKIYEIELANSKAKNLSDLQQKELLILRDKTKTILKKKKQREFAQSLISISIIISLAFLFVYLVIL